MPDPLTPSELGVILTRLHSQPDREEFRVKRETLERLLGTVHDAQHRMARTRAELRRALLEAPEELRDQVGEVFRRAHRELDLNYVPPDEA